MCGIFGYWGKNELPDENILHQCGDLIKYRGPTDSAFFKKENFYMQFHRLAILDVTNNSRQPFVTKTGWVLAFNGFIDNYLELIKKYNLKVSANSDTCMLAALMDKGGIQALKELSGMFAIALYHPQKKSLYLLRDPFGTKPLYTTVTADAFIFSSEIKPLVSWSKREINQQALWDYFSFNYIPRNKSIFKGINAIEPGSCSHYIAGKLQRQEFEFYKNQYFNESHSQPSDFYQQFTQVIDRHMRSDVPIGIMLSGGLDSAAIAAFAIRNQANISTWSLAFDSHSFDESKKSRETARMLGTDHHEILVTPENVLQHLDPVLDHLYEPFADGSAIPTFLLAKEAKKKVDVLLSGEGGDECLAGYDTYKAYYLAKYFKNKPAKFLLKGIEAFAGRLPTSYEKISLDFKIKRFMAGAGLSVPSAHFFWRHVLNEGQKSELFQKGFFNTNLLSSQDLFSNYWNQLNLKDQLNKLMTLDRYFHLAQDLMVKNDRMTMAHGIEARVPFLCSQFVSWADGLKNSEKFQMNSSKKILREKLSNRLPKSVINGKKMGLEMPYGQWFRGAWKDSQKWIVEQNPAVHAGILSGDFLLNAWQQHQSGKKDNGRFLYALLIFTHWYQNIYISKNVFKQTSIKPRPFQIFEE